MKTRIPTLFCSGLALLLSFGSNLAFSQPGRVIAMYIGPITLNDGNGPKNIGIPDSVVYSYTGTRNVYDSATTYELDTVHNTSSIIGLELYTYTAADSLLTYTSKTVSSGVATNSSRFSRYYDAAGNDSIKLNESWNTTSSTWMPIFQTSFYYTGAGQMTTQFQQSWNSALSSWANKSLFIYSYDAAGRDSAVVQQKWIVSTGSWKNVTQILKTYTSFGQIATLMAQRWSDTTSVWKDSTGVVSHYNGSNFLVDYVSGPNYNINRSSFQDSTVIVSMNATGSPLVKIRFGGNISGGIVDYLPDFRYTYSYNAANQLMSNETEIIDKNFVAYNSLSGVYAYNSAGQNTLSEPVSTNAINGILDKEQYKFYYEGTVAVPLTSSATAAGFTVYPSPATNVVTVSLGSEWQGIVNGALIDMNGKLWYQWTAPTTTNRAQQISVAGLPSGVYCLKLSTGMQSGSKILVVQH